MAKIRFNIALAVASVLLLQPLAKAQDAVTPAMPMAPGPATISDADMSALRVALSAAKSGDVNGAHAAIFELNDPVAKKLATWALINNDGASLSFNEVNTALGDLAGWPLEAQRRAAAEKLIDGAGLSPNQIVAWFVPTPPTTAEGAMALAGAEQALGRNDDAATLIRGVWRGKVFEQDVQRAMLTRFSDIIGPEDIAARADMLLYGAQGPAARDLVAMLPPDQQAVANARIALRSGASSAQRLLSALTTDQLNTPGLAFERAAYFQKHGQEPSAIALLSDLPKSPPSDDAASRIWLLRKQLVVYAIENSDARDAYLAADAGLTSGADAAEAEFYAGWLDLEKLNDPSGAAAHFANIARIGSSPITRSRALYWQGRAAEKLGDAIGAKLFYAQGATYPTTFYGQLAGEKSGQTVLDLGHDPQIDAKDRDSFESRDTVKALRLLQTLGPHDLYASFVQSLDDLLPTTQDEAQLVDLVRSNGEVALAMQVVRGAALRGLILPDRGYPLLDTPTVAGGAEIAFVHSISRQESNFDPTARSGVGARGLMQLMPATAQRVARAQGMPYSLDRLNDGTYNLTLGSAYLGNMVDAFGGSYLMAAAAYNAGPGRPSQWTSFCGDPRQGEVDPIDYIECIPFSQTRNYVMRTLETMMVYRARFNDGKTPLSLSAELARGTPNVAPAPTLDAAADAPADGGPPPIS